MPEKVTVQEESDRIESLKKQIPSTVEKRWIVPRFYTGLGPDEKQKEFNNRQEAIESMKGLKPDSSLGFSDWNWGREE